MTALASLFSSFLSIPYISLPSPLLIFFPRPPLSNRDAYVALGRISVVLTAEENLDDYPTDSDLGLRVQGDFSWETAPPSEEDGKKKKFNGGSGTKAEKEAKLSKEETKKKKLESKLKKTEAKAKSKSDKIKRKETRRRDEDGEDGVMTDDEEGEGQDGFSASDEKKGEVFKLRGLDVSIPKGSLTAIVGPIGSGKSSFLQAIAGEMRKVNGSVSFGGSVSYAPQSPWIQHLSLRENITFGRPDDQRRFQDVVSACALRQDIDMLPDGESTEIGERGVTLSGE